MTSLSTGASVVAMFEILMAALGALRSAFQSRASLVAENLVLRHQLATLRRTTPCPRLLDPIRDRGFTENVVELMASRI
jgi:hypothetical protein